MWTLDFPSDWPLGTRASGVENYATDPHQLRAASCPPRVNTVEKVFQQPGRSGLVIVDQLVPGPAASGALLWVDGVVVAVGPPGEVARQAPAGTPVFQYPGAILTAGFIDSHTHFAHWALKRRQVDLTGASTLEEAVGRVAGGPGRRAGFRDKAGTPMTGCHPLPVMPSTTSVATRSSSILWISTPPGSTPPRLLVPE